MTTGNEPLNQVIDPESLGPEVLRDNQKMHEGLPQNPWVGGKSSWQPSSGPFTTDKDFPFLAVRGKSHP
jgi:hypothetical protein